MRKILITGGTGKIGSKLVSSLVNDGHFVQFTTQKKTNGMNLIERFKLPKKLCKPLILKFEDENSIDSLSNQLTDLPDVVIHNARSLETLKISSTGHISDENFQREFYNGVTFPYQLNNHLIKLKAPIKDVIFINSIYGNVAPTPKLYKDFINQSPINYGVVKAAQLHLTKELAVRLADKMIRVNAISYGGVEGRVDKDFQKRYNQLTPSGRMLNDTDLFPPIKYIIDNPHLNITGENLKVDGGWTIW